MKYFPRFSTASVLGAARLFLTANPAWARSDEPKYLAAAPSEILSVLAPPPLAGSAEQAADLAEVRAVSHGAPAADVTLADSPAEKKFTIFSFTPAIGNFFQPGRFPKTEEFFHEVHKDAALVVDAGKDRWARPRPYAVDPSLAPGAKEKSFSYPSGHSTESMVLALVLGDLFPAGRDGILAKARDIGWHRVEIGRHYPTDIYAGRVLAQAMVREMEKSPKFQEDFREAQAEVAGAAK